MICFGLLRTRRLRKWLFWPTRIGFVRGGCPTETTGFLPLVCFRFEVHGLGIEGDVFWGIEMG